MRWLALAALIGVLVGCGSDGETTGETTGGAGAVTTFQEGSVAVDYPASWNRDAEVEAREAASGLVLLALGDSGVAGAPVRLTVLDQPREQATTRQAGKFLARTRPTDLRGRRVDDRPAVVEGADAAWQVTVDYELQPEGGGDPVPARMVDVVWVDGERQYDVSVAGPRADVEGATIDAVLASIRQTG